MRCLLIVAFWGCALGAWLFTELEVGANQSANQSARAQSMVGHALRNRYELVELLHSDMDHPRGQARLAEGPHESMHHGGVFAPQPAVHMVPPAGALPQRADGRGRTLGTFPWGSSQHSPLSGSGFDTQTAPVELGKGSFGDTWMARDRQSGRFVAVKIFYSGNNYITKAMLYRDQHLQADVQKNHEECVLVETMFRSRAMYPAGHRHICKCLQSHAFDMVAEDDVAFLVLELCGTSMQKMMEQQWARPSRGYLARVRRWMWGTLQGIEFMSSLSPPRLHMDLKLDNVVVTDSGDAKIIDFGLCIQVTEVPKSCYRTRAAPENNCRTGEMTTVYPPPYAWAYDVWTAGAMYYDLLCRRSQTVPEFHTDRIVHRLQTKQHWYSCDDGTWGLGEAIDWHVVANALQLSYTARPPPTTLLAVMYQMGIEGA